MFIRTERLFLRPVFPEDWREIFRGIAHPDVVRMLARAPWPYCEQDARDYCLRPDEPGEHRFSVTLPGPRGAALIGQIGLRREADMPELGFWIARKHRGHGYATEAGLGLLELARAIGIGGVQAGHFLDNPASGAVLRKLGFEETGEIRPTECRGRNGEIVLARRYALDLLARVPEIPTAMQAQIA